MEKQSLFHTIPLSVILTRPFRFFSINLDGDAVFESLMTGKEVPSSAAGPPEEGGVFPTRYNGKRQFHDKLSIGMPAPRKSKPPVAVRVEPMPD